MYPKVKNYTVTCSICKRTAKTFEAIDVWKIIKGKFVCFSCHWKKDGQTIKNKT